MSEWTDIGEQLRRARESKGLELKAVAHSTRIPMATLEALEDSDYSIFPSPTYARSFLAQYSEYLEVDAHEWIEAFETGDVLSSVNDHGYLQDDHDHIGTSDHQLATSRKKSKPNRSHEEKSSNGGTSILQTLTVFLVTAALIAGGIYAYQKYEHMLTGETTDTESQADNQQEPTSAGPESSPEANVPDTTPAETPENSTNVAAVDPDKTSPNTNPGSELPKGVTPTTKPKQPDPTITRPRLGPPPKAVVVEDDDE